MGGSAIEASKIAGHADVDMTAEYTFVAIERQDELTRAIQEKLRKAGEQKGQEKAAASKPPTAMSPAPAPTHGAAVPKQAARKRMARERQQQAPSTLEEMAVPTTTIQ